MSKLRAALYPLFLTLTGIALLGWAASANAFEKDARVTATLQRLEHALSESADLCPTKVDPNIREYLFLFEGAGGYAPVRAILSEADLNTTTSMGKELFPDQWSWGRNLELRKDSRGRNIYPADWSSEKIALHKLVIERRAEDGHGSMLDLVDYASPYYVEYPKRVLYYDFLTPGKAAECAKSLKKLYANARRPLALSAAGFSLGGYATVRFARKLHANKIRLKNVFTIDPVPYTHEVFRAAGRPSERNRHRSPGKSRSLVQHLPASRRGHPADDDRRLPDSRREAERWCEKPHSNRRRRHRSFGTYGHADLGCRDRRDEKNFKSVEPSPTPFHASLPRRIT